MAGLGVNIDHVATLRQARRTIEPDPVWAAVEAQLAGADCITFHLRQDRRHILDRDVPLLKASVQVKLNMEMSLTEEIVRIALDTRPQQATLVPENRQEITTEGGLDVVGQAERVAEVTRRLSEAGIVVSSFIDADERQIEASRKAGCQAIELHTGRYANAAPAQAAEELEDLEHSIKLGLELGLVVHAGHGLTYDNVQPIAAIPQLAELNIGHYLIGEAIFTGLAEAVRRMRDLMDQAR